MSESEIQQLKNSMEYFREYKERLDGFSGSENIEKQFPDIRELRTKMQKCKRIIDVLIKNL